MKALSVSLATCSRFCGLKSAARIEVERSSAMTMSIPSTLCFSASRSFPCGRASARTERARATTSSACGSHQSRATRPRGPAAMKAVRG